jgi:hypothetical protein
MILYGGYKSIGSSKLEVKKLLSIYLPFPSFHRLEYETMPANQRKETAIYHPSMKDVMEIIKDPTFSQKEYSTIIKH